jgi:long-chain acyl-CoA synthetase
MVTDTLIQLLISRAKGHPDRMALREKQYGIWIPTTWAELWQKSASFGLFLKGRGLKPGECVILWGDNKPEWLIAEIGAMAAGGVISGIYPDSLPEEAKYLIEGTDAKFIVAGDQEQADKLLKIWEEISSRVKAIIVWDSRGMNHYYVQYPSCSALKIVSGRLEETRRPGESFLLLPSRSP